jgi:hypothetical protein
MDIKGLLLAEFSTTIMVNCWTCNMQPQNHILFQYSNNFRMFLKAGLIKNVHHCCGNALQDMPS